MAHPPSPPHKASSVLLDLIEDYHSFNTAAVPTLPYPTYLEYTKQVSRGRPCVYNLDPQSSRPESHINGRSSTAKVHAEIESLLSLPAFSWSRDSLCKNVPRDVEVAITPDGRADALYPLATLPNGPVDDNDGNDDHTKAHPRTESETEMEQVFVQPATVTMSLSSLFDKLCPDSKPGSKNDEHSPVYYLQSQNSNLTSTTLSPLLSDLPANLPFAEPVLGNPEAINIWMGTGASVTSTHRDPYENLYLVLRGSKTFTLWPPVEELCLHAQKVRTAHHTVDFIDAQHPVFKITLDEAHPDLGSSGTDAETDTDTDTDTGIPWIPIDPLNLPPADVLSSKYPYYHHSHPLTVTVREREILYLPAGWFHHVTQECGTWDNGDTAPCIAVNYWYDMDYEGEKYAMREMLGRLVEAARKEEEEAE
ncbi:phospholipase A2 [Exophiala viscosa]|uniref:phospholipase A2 n=1 Tax=Exophiala viscosa TaxID=2486360 RepID=UPI0021941628|nr:phospholipase A2 [Exophiala viscosa]